METFSCLHICVYARIPVHAYVRIRINTYTQHIHNLYACTFTHVHAYAYSTPSSRDPAKRETAPKRPSHKHRCSQEALPQETGLPRGPATRIWFLRSPASKERAHEKPGHEIRDSQDTQPQEKGLSRGHYRWGECHARSAHAVRTQCKVLNVGQYSDPTFGPF